MSRAAVRILHLEPDEDTGDLGRLVADGRLLVAADLARRFATLGADDVSVLASPADGRTFGHRLRDLVGTVRPGGLVVLGSGSIPLATDAHLGRLLAVAASGERRGLTNNRHSSDVLAVGDASCLAAVPDLPADNLLPRWLATSAGIGVEELPDRALLGLDVDSPLDLELLRRHPSCPPAIAELATSAADLLVRATAALDDLGSLARDPRRELLVAGRLSAATLRRLETAAACRVRALVEERGLRASAAIAGEEPHRAPASVLGLVLDRDGPQAFGDTIVRVADGAIVDTRVLLAHRLGAGETAWPSPDDRFASDLLLAERVNDPWLARLTASAVAAPVPVALGGHTLVGPGLPLALGLPLDQPWT